MIRTAGNSILLFFFCLLLSGCGSSQESSEQKNVNNISSSKKESVRKNKSTLPIISSTKKKTQPQNKSSVGFSVTSDTIVVEKGKKDLSKKPLQQKVTEPKHFFAVQIGAFKTPANAMRAEETIKKRYRHKTLSFFDEQLKLVRVFVGNFSTAAQANEFRKTLQKEFPKEYSQSFVWELKR